MNFLLDASYQVLKIQIMIDYLLVVFLKIFFKVLPPNVFLHEYALIFYNEIMSYNILKLSIFFLHEIRSKAFQCK